MCIAHVHVLLLDSHCLLVLQLPQRSEIEQLMRNEISLVVEVFVEFVRVVDVLVALKHLLYLVALVCGIPCGICVC